MQIELINTGSELLLGLVLNTHQQWVCRRLAELGFEVSRQVAVPDSENAIEAAVREAQKRVNLIITTGGLGPTSDDRTRDHISKMFDLSLREDPVLSNRIEEIFRRRGFGIPDSVMRQALVPEGAFVLENEFGTAPGLILNLPSPDAIVTTLVMLPGPPRELRPMFDHHLIPWLRKHFPCRNAFSHRTLRSVGLGESRIEEQLRDRLAPLIEQGLELGYCARIGEVDVRMIAQGENAKSLIDEATIRVKEKIGESIYAEGEDVLEAILVRDLAREGKTLSLAESCTGGLIAHRLTNVPGASQILDSAMITYSNEAKMSCLGVSPKTISEHGAVSEATAREMAKGARKVSGSDYALATTGIAGPSGGSEEKPVGTVFIGFACEKGTRVSRYFNPLDRESFKSTTSQQALEMLRQAHQKLSMKSES